MPYMVKLIPGEDVEMQMKIAISMTKDIICTVILLPLFKRAGLKLTHYEFITNSTAVEDAPWGLKKLN